MRMHIQNSQYQFEALDKLVSSELDKLNRLITSLPPAARTGRGSRAPGGQDPDSAAPAPDSPYEMIYISRASEIVMNGNTVGMAALSKGLESLAAVHGMVLYAREAPEPLQEAPLIAAEVMKLVMAYRLPIAICTNGDFSDAVDIEGHLRLQPGSARLPD
jgi:hypothetical protein